MKSVITAKRLPANQGVKGKRKPHSIPLNVAEDQRLLQLMSRYQQAVVAKNQELGEHHSANVTPCDMMRTGLTLMDELTPEELRIAVLNTKHERG